MATGEQHPVPGTEIRVHLHLGPNAPAEQVSFMSMYPDKDMYLALVDEFDNPNSRWPESPPECWKDIINTHRPSNALGVGLPWVSCVVVVATTTNHYYFVSFSPSSFASLFSLVVFGFSERYLFLLLLLCLQKHPNNP